MHARSWMPVKLFPKAKMAFYMARARDDMNISALHNQMHTPPRAYSLNTFSSFITFLFIESQNVFDKIRQALIAAPFRAWKNRVANM